ncbi:protein kinase [Ancylothrix sp. C2]|uniref:protein kinase domain-containing protein n=1 Tax=Ancylothrix sp. D3o TaxID=2953691 RepID=UPI0021BA5510|nr:serine/threonine-protein kinase [Ancylothrix sp. D3o]MCT7951272.1 protein kinase [Ancylothrix sp. D3o]
MIYCINPKCSNRENPNDLDACHHCGSSLLINDRYRVVKPLRPLNPTYPTDIYEVKDWGGVDEDWGAIKVLKVLKYNNNSDLVRHFQQEARVLMFLRDSGFPSVQPEGYFTFSPKKTTQKLHCLVMEKIEGENLTTWLQENGPINLENALEWLKELTQLIDKLHEQNLAHRDIKPSNIVVRPNGNLSIIDFGIAGVDNWGETCVGTTGYAPSEQIIGKAVLRSDFFALGRTFVELITGLSPMDFPSDEKTGKIFWREKAKTLNFKQPADLLFAGLLDDLMQPAYEKRPRNTRAILKRIQVIEKALENPVKFRYQKLAITAGLIVAGIISIPFVFPTLNDLFRRIGTDKYLEGDLQGAKIYYSLAEKINPNFGPNLYSIGLICEDQKNLECARNKYLAASKSDEQHSAASAISNLSRIEILNRNIDTAINLLTPNLERSNHPRIKAALYKNLGWAEYAKGNSSQAETHLQKAIKLKDENPEYKNWSAPHCLLAKVLEEQGKKPAALLQWDYCLKYAHLPNRIEEQTWRVEAYQRLNKSAKQK